MNDDANEGVDPVPPPVPHGATYYLKHVSIALGIGVSGGIAALVITVVIIILLYIIFAWLGHPSRMFG